MEQNEAATEPTTSARGEQAARVWVGVLVLAAGGLTLLASRHGIGLGPDPAAYLAGGLRLHHDPGTLFRLGEHPAIGSLEKWPPFYPAFLAGLGGTATDVLDRARLAHAALASILVLLIALVLRRAASWKVTALALTVVVTASGLFTSVYANLLSEPLFLVLVWAAIATFDRALTAERPARATTWMLAAWVLVAAAGLTRLLGLAMVPALLLAVWLLGRRHIARSAVWVGAALALAPGLYSLTGRDQTDRASTFQFQSTFFSRLPTAGLTIDSWFVPHDLLGTRAAQAVVGLAVAGLGVLGLIWFVRWAKQALADRPDLAPADRITAVLLLVGGGYFAMLLWNAMFVDRVTPMADRHLLPVWLVVIAVVALQARHAIDRATLRTPWLLVVLAFIVILGGQTAIDVRDASSEGLGYSSVNYADAIEASVGSLPADTVIYSDRADAIFSRTGRPVQTVPRLDLGDERFDAAAERIAEQVRSGEAAIVYLDIEPQRSYFPTPEELAEASGLTLVEGDGYTALVAES